MVSYLLDFVKNFKGFLTYFKKNYKNEKIS